MPEDTPLNASSPEASPGAQQPAAPADSVPETPISLTSERNMERQKNLPPIKIVLIAIGIVAMIAAIVLILMQRPHSLATGSIADVSSVDVSGQNLVMVGMNVSLQNPAQKLTAIKSIRSQSRAPRAISTTMPPRQWTSSDISRPFLH